MHETPIDLLDAGMTAHERQRRVAIRKINAKLGRGKISAKEFEAALKLAGEAFVEIGKAINRTATIIVDSISTAANQLKPVLEALTSDNFDQLIRNLPDKERDTLTALRNAAMQLEGSNLPVTPIRSQKRNRGPQQKFLPPPKSVRGKGKQHHRRRR